MLRLKRRGLTLSKERLLSSLKYNGLTDKEASEVISQLDLTDRYFVERRDYNEVSKEGVKTVVDNTTGYIQEIRFEVGEVLLGDIELQQTKSYKFKNQHHSTTSQGHLTDKIVVLKTCHRVMRLGYQDTRKTSEVIKIIQVCGGDSDD